MKRIILYFVLVLIAVSMLLPFLGMILISLSGNENIFTDYKNINLNFCAYKNVFKSIPVAKYFLNSFVVALFTTIGQVLISALAGYGFARLKFKGSNVLFYAILITMMVPPQVNIVPLFYLMRNYFLKFSTELEDAAKLDGCSAFQIFFKIAFPCAAPALATLSIFTFVTAWNSFMWPLIVTNTDSMRTLAVGLTVFKSSFREITMWGELTACACICSIPVILIFLIGKNYLINNPQEGGIKGG